ncbi:hypothetical protein [Streptomyces sp. NPDC000983]|uniref:hypothetical protein n=1 Tax=Streptomyces sp. NPDC000983 TaxID=3154373 RepID=UPI003320169C
MRNRVRIATAAVATALVVTGVGLWVRESESGHSDGGLGAEVRPEAALCVGSRPGPSAATNDTSDDTPLNRLITHIDSLARERHADVFTGLSVDEDAGAADLYRIPSPAFDEAVCEAAEQGVQVRLHDTDVDRAALDALAERISEDMTRWDGTFDMREVAVDERGWVHVGVDEPGTAEPLVHGAFGEEHIRVVHVGQASADRTQNG